MLSKVLVVLALAAVCVAAMETAVDVEAEKPHHHRRGRGGKKLHRPIIVGAVAGHHTEHLRVVIVPKGDPRARGGRNPFLPQSPASTVTTAGGAPVLRASAPLTSVTQAQLLGCMPGLSSSKAATVLPFLNAAMAEADVNNCARTSAFLAQLGHESGSLVYMQELASGAAYEGRRDLGNTQPGDGKRFKGRGPIQLTGRANYIAAGKALGLDLVDNPTIVATNQVGFRTSAWFWKSHGLNELADQGAFSTITRRINGGTNGAADRNARWAKCKVALACNGGAAPAAPAAPATNTAACAAKKGTCQTAPCNGVVVHNLCGAGAATCCTPKSAPVLQAAAPTANTAACAAQQGKCQVGGCTGTVVHNLCGAGAATCCVPPGVKVVTPAVGELGLDVSQPLSATAAKCMKSNGYKWIGIRGGRSSGTVDPNAAQSLRNAAAAGYTADQLSVYIFPFTTTTDSTSGGRQVTAMWNNLKSVSSLFGTIWLDIEAAKWESVASNQKFFESMVSACKATGKTCGVYTSKVYWQQIMGSSYSGGASLPLWYPHYQIPAQQAMSDFSPFGGWSAPWAKQYKETTTVCGIGADLNVKNSNWKAPSSAPVLKSGAPTPIRKILQSGAPATSSKCAALKGTCATSCSNGHWVHGLCSGTPVCCVPNSAAPAKPAKPAPAKPAPAPTAASSVTVAQLTACMPGLSTSKATTVLPFLNAAQAEAQINTCKRKTAWLAQLGHESGSLVYMQELASGAAYEGRKDLGNTQPGDGKRFKGRGPIQLTGRANYVAAGKALGLDLVDNPTIVATNQVGFRTSAWFWSSHGLNALADRGAFTTITARINGGQNGAADRVSRYNKCRRVLGC